MARLSKKKDDKLWIKWNPADWNNDAQLALCSAHSKGIWMDMLMKMFFQKIRGTLPGDSASLVKILPHDKEAIEEAIIELKAKEVLSTGREIDPRLPPDCLVNRRMFRENMIIMSRVEAGKKGLHVLATMHGNFRVPIPGYVIGGQAVRKVRVGLGDFRRR